MCVHLHYILYIVHQQLYIQPNFAESWPIFAPVNEFTGLYVWVIPGIIGVHGSVCVYEHGNEKGYGVSKYFPPVPRRRCRVLLYCGTAAIQPGELYEIIVLIQLEK